MILLSASDVLRDRHMAFTLLRGRLKIAEGPALTPDLTWPAFWAQVNRVLDACGYRKSTRRQYRAVLRAFRKSGVCRPSDAAAPRVQRLLNSLVEAHASWSWIALHISALRTIFDELCGMEITSGLVTPKRPWRLPEILSRREAEDLVRAGRSIRDQLLLGLLYGCGLTGSDAAGLRWRNVIAEGTQLHVNAGTRYLERIVCVPPPLRSLLCTGVQTCDPDEYVFRGRAAETHISNRAIEKLVREASIRARIERPVCVSTLRHSFAVHRLESGAGLHEVQLELGHASIRTTERYRRCLTPRLDTHPYTKVRALMHAYAGIAVPSPKETRTPRAPANEGRPLSGLDAVDLRGLRLPFTPDANTNPLLTFAQAIKNRLISGFLRRPAHPSP